MKDFWLAADPDGRTHWFEQAPEKNENGFWQVHRSVACGTLPVSGMGVVIPDDRAIRVIFHAMPFDDPGNCLCNHALGSHHQRRLDLSTVEIRCFGKDCQCRGFHLPLRTPTGP